MVTSYVAQLCISVKYPHPAVCLWTLLRVTLSKFLFQSFLWFKKSNLRGFTSSEKVGRFSHLDRVTIQTDIHLIVA